MRRRAPAEPEDAEGRLSALAEVVLRRRGLLERSDVDVGLLTPRERELAVAVSDGTTALGAVAEPYRTEVERALRVVGRFIEFLPDSQT